MTDPILLTDEQMREFIVNGYLVFEPTVPEGTHEACYERLNQIIDSELNPGNNILPRVPAMRHVLNSPEVRGALISVLGPNYLEQSAPLLPPPQAGGGKPCPRPRPKKGCAATAIRMGTRRWAIRASTICAMRGSCTTRRIRRLNWGRRM